MMLAVFDCSCKVKGMDGEGGMKFGMQSDDFLDACPKEVNCQFWKL